VELLVLSNVNLAPIVRRVPGNSVTLGEYGDVLPALVDPGSSAYRQDLDAVVVLLDADELLAAGDLLEELPDAFEAFRAARPDVLLVASTLRADPATVATYASAQDPEGNAARVTRFNEALRALAASATNVAILDLGLVFDRHGRDALIARAFWYAGRIPYTSLWFEECGKHLSGLLDAYRGLTRKVLVCDLDGTLWGGVLGEEGPGGIAVGEDGVGKCYRDLQRRIKALQETGVLLAIASKNDHADAESVLTDHPMMILRPDDFAAMRIEWDDKVTSLRSIADELSLGLESFVFVDDNPVERALVAEHLPEVAVVEVPTRPELLADWFVRDVAFPYFARLRILDADRAKTEQYRTRSKRVAVAAQAPDLHAFLAGLDIRLDLRVDDEFLVERAAQMTQKTNQFNLTMRRCTPAEILEWVQDAQHAVVTLGYQDRFGDEGVVGLAVLDRANAELPLFLLSCRVIGRGVEDRLLDRVEEVARETGLGAIECTFVPTVRNGVAAAFLPARGWTAMADEAAQHRGEAVRYRKELR
jgi:FkbH-like protein